VFHDAAEVGDDGGGASMAVRELVAARLMSHGVVMERRSQRLHVTGCSGGTVALDRIVRSQRVLLSS
jgi:hypothetical protein